MADLFEEKSQDWDMRDLPRRISAGVGTTLLDSVRLEASMEVMDFGAGTGLITGQIAPRVASICAVDISAAMLEKLVAKPELAGKVEAVCQDILAEPLARSFDLIVSAMALHHVEDTPLLLRRFHQHLRPGGSIALADLDAEDGSFHPPGTEGVYHSGFARQELTAQLLAAGFTEVAFHTAVELEKEGRCYPIFLVTARRT